MAFDLVKTRSYGTGALGDVTDPTGILNSYAPVTSYTATTVTINTGAQSIGAYEQFEAGNEIMLHVASGSQPAYLGKYLFVKIVSVADNVLTVDGDFTAVLPLSEATKYHVQAITTANFKNLYLNNVAVGPLQYNASSHIGGLVVIKATESVTFGGGHITLTDRGIPVNQTALRPLTAQENTGTSDYSIYAGWENHMTERQLILNCGDGAVFISTAKLACNANSRIGNTASYGAQFCRGYADSVGSKPGSTTNVGGSTILIAAETISNFDVRMISKYRASTASAGRGLGRAYIASNTKLRNDEGLYAYDVISTPLRLMEDCNIKSFGTGNLGDINNPTTILNNYARVTAISNDGKTITYASKTTNGLAQIGVNAMVMVHFAQAKNTSEVTNLGRIWVDTVLADSNSKLTLEKGCPLTDISNYYVQIVSIPQFGNVTISNNYTATPAWNGTQGGVCAFAAKGTANLSNGMINVQAKGGGVAYGKAGLAVIGNAQSANIMPMGQGHGSVFILANKLTMNNNTRIGAVYSGANFGGYGWNASGGFRGNAGGYRGYNWEGTGGHMAVTDSACGYGGNGLAWNYGSYHWRSYQGAHIFIVADTLTGFNQYAISTGGSCCYPNAGDSAIGHGGAGYGGGSADGGSGANGGGYAVGAGRANFDGINGGAGSGWAFIYSNNEVNPNYTGAAV